jgi:hypothetical protein
VLFEFEGLLLGEADNASAGVGHCVARARILKEKVRGQCKPCIWREISSVAGTAAALGVA